MKDETTIDGEALMAKLAELADREIGGGCRAAHCCQGHDSRCWKYRGGDTQLTCAVEPPLI